MKKTMRKVVAVVLAATVAVGCLAGCGGKGASEKKGGTKNIQIRLLEQGFGDQWLKDLIEGFTKKYPDYSVTYDASASSAAVKATYGMEKDDTYDLYFCNRIYDVTYMEDLTDVLDTKVEGESKSIREKFNSAYLEMEEYEGKYPTLTWGGGVEGFVYNKEFFDKAGITTLPRTTDELSLVCDMLKEAGYTPLCHFVGDGYYSHINEVWFAQYSGLDYWKDFYNNPSQEKMTTEDGRLEALKVHEKLNSPDNVLVGSNSDSHIAMQTKFLDGSCAMMLNGSWLASEMSNVGKMDNFTMMKTPVISSIREQLTTVKTEGDLRKLITAIDNVTDGTESEDTYKDGENYKVEGKSVSAADWERVREARNMMPVTHAGTTSFVPTYSDAKEGAKEFLKYMYSDEGYKIYLNALHVTLPLSLDSGEVDISTWNAFEQNQAQLFAQTETTLSNLIMNKDRIFIDGGADSFVSYPFVSRISAKSEKDRMSANDAWDYIVDVVNDRYEKTWMANIK